MGRKALQRETHSSETNIDQLSDLKPLAVAQREEGDIIRGDTGVHTKAYQDEMAFMEEPVTIRIEPGSEENSPTAMMLCVNGRGCECLMPSGKWRSYPGGWIPIGEILTIKRKYLEVLARSKIDRIETIVPDIGASEADLRAGSKIRRFTRQAHSFSVIKDANPRGADWLTSIIKRNL